MRPMCGSSFFSLSNVLVQVYDIELSHIGKNNGNPELLCEYILKLQSLTEANICTLKWISQH